MMVIFQLRYELVLPEDHYLGSGVTPKHIKWPRPIVQRHFLAVQYLKSRVWSDQASQMSSVTSLQIAILGAGLLPFNMWSDQACPMSVALSRGSLSRSGATPLKHMKCPRLAQWSLALPCGSRFGSGAISNRHIKWPSLAQCLVALPRGSLSWEQGNPLIHIKLPSLAQYLVAFSHGSLFREQPNPPHPQHLEEIRLLDSTKLPGQPLSVWGEPQRYPTLPHVPRPSMQLQAKELPIMIPELFVPSSSRALCPSSSRNGDIPWVNKLNYIITCLHKWLGSNSKLHPHVKNLNTCTPRVRWFFVLASSSYVVWPPRRGS